LLSGNNSRNGKLPNKIIIVVIVVVVKDFSKKKSHRCLNIFSILVWHGNTFQRSEKAVNVPILKKS